MSRSCQMTIVNGTSLTLKLIAKDSGLHNGVWDGGPIDTVLPNKLRTVGNAIGSDEFYGNLVYEAEGELEGQQFVFGFYNPSGADNAFNCKAPEGYYVCPFVQDGGYGTDDPAVTYVLCKALGVSQPFQVEFAHKSCVAQVVNGTDEELKFINVENQQGWFDGGPIDKIESHKIVVAANEKTNNPELSANLYYNLQSSKGTNTGKVKMGWYNPFGRDNQYYCYAPDGYYICPFVQNGGYRTSDMAPVFVICKATNGN